MDRRLFLSLISLAAVPAMAAANEGGDKAVVNGDSYVAMNTLLGTTLQANGNRGVLSVDCGLDVPDPALRERTRQSIPRLRAAYVQTIQAYAAGLGAGSLPNADYLSQTLQRQTDSVLGRPGARLLLGAIIAN